METSLQKALLTVSTLALCVIAVQLIPLSRKANHQLICAEGLDKQGEDENLRRKLRIINNQMARNYCIKILGN